ncbi:adenylyltransferase/cytidyltransferase family protein [Cupriavidus necator]|uniref:adenylyltransferase/cytidyltransferase family protein n=1 Tax=Cupriavidus necator TaxID=106590 RepID=UPI00339D9C6D
MAILDGITELQAIAHGYRSGGLVIGLCHGCFDIVHVGHIHHLQQASTIVDRLFVSITADKYVNKGPDRPVFPGRSRAEFIASLRYCDHVIVNHAATAEPIISALQPDAFFKGADYRSSSDSRLQAERELVESNGGRVILTDDMVLDSTSRIVQLITAMAGNT